MEFNGDGAPMVDASSASGGAGANPTAGILDAMAGSMSVPPMSSRVFLAVFLATTFWAASAVARDAGPSGSPTAVDDKKSKNGDEASKKGDEATGSPTKSGAPDVAKTAPKPISPPPKPKPKPPRSSPGRGRKAPKAPPKVEEVDSGVEPIVLDAGPPELDAGETDAGIAVLPEGAAVTYHGNDSPLVFRVDVGDGTKADRAAKATELLTRALDGAGELDEPPEPSVKIERGVGAVRIGKSLIATVYPVDATANHAEFDRYVGDLDSQMRSWVPAQLRRRAVQLFALHIFLSIFFGVLGFLTLRFLRNGFDRWETEFDERRGSLPAISILRIPIFSSEAVGGAVAFGLAVGRVLAYVVIAISTLAAVLSQFDFTRPLLRRLVSWSGGPLLNGLELVVTSIPGLVVAAILIVALRAALRVLNLLLDGVSKKRIVWNQLPPTRVPVFRFATTAATIILVAPLLVAAAFGRFGTPLETLALGAGGAVLLAAVPMLASYVIGIRLLWREALKPGDWVQVGDVSGEVTSCGFSEIALVPEGGGTIAIPMIFLVMHPLRRLREAPAVSFDLTVARDRPVKELLEAIDSAVREVEPDVNVELADMCHAWIKVVVSAPAVRTGVRQTLLVAVSNAVDEHLFELPTLHGPERF